MTPEQEREALRRVFDDAMPTAAGVFADALQASPVLAEIRRTSAADALREASRRWSGRNQTWAGQFLNSMADEIEAGQ